MKSFRPRFIPQFSKRGSHVLETCFFHSKFQESSLHSRRCKHIIIPLLSTKKDSEVGQSIFFFFFCGGGVKFTHSKIIVSFVKNCF